MNTTKIAKAEIAKLANMLNSNAAQLSAAREDIAKAITRIEATERSSLVIQKAILIEINKENRSVLVDKE